MDVMDEFLQGQYWSLSSDEFILLQQSYNFKPMYETEFVSISVAQ